MDARKLKQGYKKQNKRETEKNLSKSETIFVEIKQMMHMISTMS